MPAPLSSVQRKKHQFVYSNQCNSYGGICGPLHSEMNVCHLGISLENLLITDVFVMSEQGPIGELQIYSSHCNFQIKFCDFGLSTAFDGKDFRCTYRSR
eukprot:8501_1